MISQQNEVVIKRLKPLKVGVGKQIVYRFNGDPRHDEVLSDRTGEIPRLWVGDTLNRNGKKWKVAVVNNDFDMTASAKAIPIHRVFLTDKF
jgi:hypothetical protein